MQDPSIRGQLTEENNYLVGTFNDCYKTTTITLSTADKYLDKDISITANVKEGHLAVTEQAFTVKQGTPTVCNIVLSSTQKKGTYITMPKVTYTVPGFKYQVDTSGWMDETELKSVGGANGMINGDSFSVISMTLANDDSIELTDSNGTWTWKADADGNTYIY